HHGYGPELGRRAAGPPPPHEPDEGVLMASTTRHPAKKPLMVVTAVATLCLTVAVLFGAGNAVVYPVAGLALASVGAFIYLTQNAQNCQRPAHTLWPGPLVGPGPTLGKEPPTWMRFWPPACSARRGGSTNKRSKRAACWRWSSPSAAACSSTAARPR